MLTESIRQEDIKIIKKIWTYQQSPQNHNAKTIAFVNANTDILNKILAYRI